MPSSAASGVKAVLERFKIEAVQLPLDAHEEEAQVVVDVLVGVQNVRAALVEQPRNARHQALAIGAIDQQNGGIFHVLSDYALARRTLRDRKRPASLVR